MKFSSRTWIIIFAATVFIAAGLSIPGLHINQDILSILPQDDAQMVRYREVLRDFNPMNAVYVDLHLQKDEGSELPAISDTLLSALKASHLFNRILHRWQLSGLSATLDTLRRYRADLFSAADSARVAPMLAADSITQRLGWWKQQLSSSPSPFLVRQMLRDPLGMDALLNEKISGLQRSGSGIRISGGRLLSADGRHSLIIAFPSFQVTSTNQSRRLVAFMDSLSTDLKRRFKEEQPRLSWLSGHRYSVENESRIRNDIGTTVTISLLAITLLALFVYRQPYLMLLTLAPALFGSVVALGSLRWLIPQISAIALGSGAMLIGLAVDYGIHFLYHADRLGLTRINRDGLTRLRKKLRRPLILSALTTIVAFSVLQLTDLPGFRQLGIFVAIGIFSALLFVLFVLPHILPRQLRLKRGIPTLDATRIFPPLFDFTQRNRLWILTAVVLVTVAFFPGFLSMRFDGDLQKMNASSQRMEDDRTVVEQSLGTTMHGTFIVVSDTKANRAFARNDSLAALLKGLQQKGTVESFVSVAQLFPAVEKRQANRRRWEQVFGVRQRHALAGLLNKSAVENGFKANVFDDFVRGLRMPHSYLTAKSFRRTVLQELWQAQVVSTTEHTAILTQLRLRRGVDFNRFRGELAANGPAHILYNGRALATHTIQLIRKEMEHMALWVLGLILLLLLISERKLKSILGLLAPLLISAIWTFGLMRFLGESVNIVNSVVSVFIFGLIIDYSFFLKVAVKNGSDELARSGAAVLLSALTTMCALGALAFAGHPALHTLGLTAFIGIGSGLAAALLMIPISFRVGNGA